MTWIGYVIFPMVITQVNRTYKLVLAAGLPFTNVVLLVNWLAAVHVVVPPSTPQIDAVIYPGLYPADDQLSVYVTPVIKVPAGGAGDTPGGPGKEPACKLFAYEMV